MEDIAGREGQFTLEKHGFMYARQTSTAMRTRDDLRDSKKIVKEYYPEMVELLKRVYVLCRYSSQTYSICRY